MTEKTRFPSVIFRKYVFQVGISLFCLLFYTILSLAVCQKATLSYAERERYRKAELNEIVFSHSSDYEEPFYSFNSCARVYGGGHRMNADILMTVGGKSYRGNPLYFKNSLPKGGCAISENLASDFNVCKGDTVTVTVGSQGKEFDFTVSEILPAESGIDGKYMHEGIVILAENTDVIGAVKENTEVGEICNYIFISFTKDHDGFEAPDNSRENFLVYTEDLIASAEGRLITYALLSTAALWVFIALSETVIFSRVGKKYRDYIILSYYGISRTRLFAKVLLDNSIKYLLPLAVSFFIWLLRLRIYRMAYLVPALTFAAIGIITVTVLTLITVMRKQGCQKIKR